jgi:hypothetical protein
VAGDDNGMWEALIGGPSIEHAHAAVRGSPEVAMSRAEQRYGRQEWGQWRFRAELCAQSVTLRTVHYAWRDDGLMRL